jgi:tetratricopeptide (TPR) repeat protein
LKCLEVAQNLGINNYESYLVSAENFIKIGDYKKSIQISENAVRINPYDSRGYYFLGMNYFHIRDLNQSMENFRKAVNLKPDFADAYNGMGLCCSEALHFTVKSLKNISKKP